MCSRESMRRTRERGFSLVEVLLVIAIIAILATMVTINVRSYLLKARQSRARSDIATLVTVLNTFFSEYGRYPTNEEGLEALTRTSGKFPEPLLERLPKDPWGNPYQYVSSGPREFVVISLGAEGREGGIGVDADISSEHLEGE